MSREDEVRRSAAYCARQDTLAEVHRGLTKIMREGRTVPGQHGHPYVRVQDVVDMLGELSPTGGSGTP
jgi:hypothetical protein